MPRTMYQTCELIMEEVKKEGFEDQVAWPDLVKHIRVIAGSSPLTLNRYRSELCKAGFLKTENGLTFDIQKKA